MILLIDNYDSFTYNLADLFGQLGQEVDVRRNDAIDADGAEELAPTQLVISPGPGRPEDAGNTGAILERLAGRVPTLGVCLGHQALVQRFGGEVGFARELVHGKAALEQARRCAEALFSGDVSGLDAVSLAQVFEDAPSSQHEKAALAEAGAELVELLVKAGVASSKRESRQLLESGAISINGQRVGLERRLVETDLLHGSMALVRRGRKNWHVLRFA